MYRFDLGKTTHCFLSHGKLSISPSSCSLSFGIGYVLMCLGNLINQKKPRGIHFLLKALVTEVSVLWDKIIRQNMNYKYLKIYLNKNIFSPWHNRNKTLILKIILKAWWKFLNILIHKKYFPRISRFLFFHSLEHTWNIMLSLIWYRN